MRQLATGRTDEALAVYEARDMVHSHESKALAREALVEGWAAERKADPRSSRVILAYTRDDVSSLNALARDRLKLEGELGPDQGVKTAQGERSLAAGDRVMFLKNERSMGVKNGTLGTVEGFNPGTVAVRLDDGRSVTVDLKAYNDIDHGYASTIHKSQGVTVDRARVLASGHMDRHAAYVALSRHRDGVELHYSRDEFATRSDLVPTLGRDRPKDMALDYRQEFAERRDIREAPAMALSRGPFEGFRPRPTPELDRSHSSSWETQSGLDAGIRTYAKAFADVERVRQLKLPVLPHQEAAMDRAAKALSAIDKDAARDLHSALARTPGLAGEIDQPGRRSAILQAMVLEREVRTNPERRADRFVENWTQLKADRARLTGWRYTEARDAVERRMQSLADGLHRDPQLESVLANRRRELGLHRGSSGHSLEHDLPRSLGIDRGLGL